MDNYLPSDDDEIIEASPSFPREFTENVPVMRIKKNTKFGGIIDHVQKLFEDESARHVIFEGAGDGTDKCISCVEVLKRKSQFPLYQWNALQTAKRIVFWNPIFEGLDRLKVTIDIPVMYILISKDPFPTEHQCLSMQCSQLDMAPAYQEKKPKKKNPGSAPPNKWTRPDKTKTPVPPPAVKEREAILKTVKASP